MFYAGCRYAIGCRASELLQINGYLTSSKTVKKLINEEGLDSFVIDRVKEFTTKFGGYRYETRFLKKINVPFNDKFINLSRNTPYCPDILSIRLAKIKTSLARYGAKNPMQNRAVRARQVNTVVSRYGVDNISKLSCIKASKLKTRLENNGGVYETELQRSIRYKTNTDRYGDNLPTRNVEVKAKTKQTCLSRYGVEFVLQVPEIRETIKQTCIDKYGVDNPSKSKEVIDKISSSIQNSLGVSWAMQSEVVKQKSKQTCLEKYGVDHPSKLADYQQLLRDRAVLKYGVDSYAKTDESKLRKIERDSNKRNRQIVKDIKKLSSFMKTTIGKGWDLKRDNDLVEIFNRLLLDFNKKGLICN